MNTMYTVRKQNQGGKMTSGKAPPQMRSQPRNPKCYPRRCVRTHTQEGGSVGPTKSELTFENFRYPNYLICCKKHLLSG